MHDANKLLDLVNNLKVVEVEDRIVVRGVWNRPKLSSIYCRLPFFRLDGTYALESWECFGVRVHKRMFMVIIHSSNKVV